MNSKYWPKCLRMFPYLSKLTVRMDAYDSTNSSGTLDFSMKNVSELNLIGSFASHHLGKCLKLSLEKSNLENIQGIPASLEPWL